MAGSFGFEAEHFEISQAVGERVLLPAARKASDSTIVADGFSCREQVAQLAGKRPKHIAEILREAQTGASSRDRDQKRPVTWTDHYGGVAAAACVAIGAGLAAAHFLLSGSHAARSGRH